MEWLNEQIGNVDVLAVEVAHYGGVGHRAVVPRVVGATARAAERKAQTTGPGFDALLAAAPADVHEVYERLEAWADEHGVDRVNTAKSRRYVADYGLALG